jgi:hypothetical protein
MDMIKTSLILQTTKDLYLQDIDRLCGLVVRAPGYRSRGPGFYSRRYQIFWEVVGLEWGPTKPREDNWGATWMEK